MHILSVRCSKQFLFKKKTGGASFYLCCLKIHIPDGEKEEREEKDREINNFDLCVCGKSGMINNSWCVLELHVGCVMAAVTGKKLACR